MASVLDLKTISLVRVGAVMHEVTLHSLAPI